MQGSDTLRWFRSTGSALISIKKYKFKAILQSNIAYVLNQKMKTEEEEEEEEGKEEKTC